MTAKGAVVLVVDDDPAVLGLLEPALGAAGFRVRTASSADQAFAVISEESVDLILLDFKLPGISGLKLLEILKQDPSTSSIPVIMQTTRGSEADRVTGLVTGADDYVVKPFSVKELLARVDALLRRVRHEGRSGRTVQCGGVRLDLDARTVEVEEGSVGLTSMEFDILLRLLRRPGQVLTYQVLSAELSEGARILTSENLYAHIKNLRRKLGGAGERIATVYGIGYKFEPR